MFPEDFVAQNTSGEIRRQQNVRAIRQVDQVGEQAIVLGNGQGLKWSPFSRQRIKLLAVMRNGNI